MAGKIRILLAENHPVMMHGLVQLLESQRDFVVVASCADGEAALALARQHCPDLALLDLRMPKIDGLSLIKTLRAECPRTRTVLLSTRLSDKAVFTAVTSGVWGFILKESTPEMVLRCLRQVASGEPWMPPQFVPQALQREKLVRKKVNDLVKLLTPRELEVINLLSRGCSNKEIGKEMNLAEGTVKLHVHNIYGKLSVKKRPALAALGAMLNDRVLEAG